PAGSLFNYTNARRTLLDYSRGLIANYSSVITNRVVNNFRYGFIRESIGNSGDSDQTYIIMRGITQGVTRSQSFQVPSHNFTEDDATYNYLKNGSVLPQGAPVTRHFAVDSYEVYAQDSLKFRPNLTVTFGLRYSLTSPPWETNGLQVAPCQLQGSTCTGLDLGKWFDQRHQNMLQGIPSNQDPLVSFELAGPANGGKPGFYKWNKKDFGPRLALAWTPRSHSGLLKSLFGEGDKTVIRAGAAVVYD